MKGLLGSSVNDANHADSGKNHVKFEIHNESVRFEVEKNYTSRESYAYDRPFINWIGSVISERFDNRRQNVRSDSDVQSYFLGNHIPHAGNFLRLGQSNGGQTAEVLPTDFIDLLLRTIKMDSQQNSNGANRLKKRSKLRRRLILERLTDRRVLAAITGMVFEDANDSFQQDAAEVALPHRLVYLDVNQNAVLDTGETFAVADENGDFSIQGLPDGDYDLRLYDGSVTQSQTFPIDAAMSEFPVAASDLTQVLVDGNNIAGISANSLVIGDLSDGATRTLGIGNAVSQVQRLPDGNLLLVGGDGTGEAAWIADPNSLSLTATDLSEDGSIAAWSDLAINDLGYGLLVEQTENEATLLTIDASDADDGVVANDVGFTVPSDTQVVTSPDGTRSILAWSGPSGLQLSLWSNVTGTYITYVPVDIAGVTELLAFDDGAGLVVLRTDVGGVSIHDANADFASLLVLPEVTGPIALDGERELIGTVNESESALKLINLRDGQSVAELPVDMSAIGNVNSLVWESGSDSIVAVGSAGASQIALADNAAHRVRIVDGQDPEPVEFGVRLAGENTLPYYAPAVPSFETNEDTTLVSVFPTVATGLTDEDGDNVVILPAPAPTKGSAVVSTDGILTYHPNPDYWGDDVAAVIIHDGRGAIGVALDIDINPVNDAPVVTVELDDVVEHATPGTILGQIAVFDVENGDVIVESIDPRFEVQGNQIVFIGDPRDLNFEQESTDTVPLTVVNGEFYDEIYATLNILDVNEPITDIDVYQLDVVENAAGEFVATLFAEDDDINQAHTFSVDDDRFVIVNDELFLSNDASLDYEAAPIVTVNVTAKEIDGPHTYTKEIKITVVDVPEMAQSIELSNQTVTELEPGDLVGTVLVDGFALPDSYTATVDDGRFRIDGTTLRLADGQWVERATQEEIELNITVTDVAGQFDSLTEKFVIQVVENPTPFHNDAEPLDVDGSGNISPGDALIIINYINSHGFGEIEHGDPNFDYDVNGDGRVTPADALAIINYITLINSTSSSGTVGGENPRGEQIEASPDPDAIADSVQIDLLEPANADDDEENVDPSPSLGANRPKLRSDRSSNNISPTLASALSNDAVMNDLGESDSSDDSESLSDAWLDSMLDDIE